MNIVLHELLRSDNGVIQLLLSCGADSPRIFNATYDGADTKYKCCSVDQELFMLLSDFAHKRFGNCTVYQNYNLAIMDSRRRSTNGLVVLSRWSARS
jgi:hypothetical protein